jgi:hypothetical protein
MFVSVPPPTLIAMTPVRWVLFTFDVASQEKANPWLVCQIHCDLLLEQHAGRIRRALDNALWRARCR